MGNNREDLPRKGLTLLELLVVLGIVGVLVGITVVAVVSARQAYHSLQCKNNQKQIMMGLLGYLFQNQKWEGNNLGVPQVNVFPYILNRMRSRVLVLNGYRNSSQGPDFLNPVVG